MRGPLASECERAFDDKRLARTGVLDPRALGGGGWKQWRDRDPQVLWHAFALARWLEANG
jgi:hypothetical protein